MPRQPLAFENATSILYYSNDGRLEVEQRDDDVLNRRYYRLNLDGEFTGFETFDRVKADAYIAGYDLAREH